MPGTPARGFSTNGIGTSSPFTRIDVARRSRRTRNVTVSRAPWPGPGPEALPTAAMATAPVAACGGQVDEAFALLEPMLESLESIDPLGELRFVLSGTAQSLVLIEQWA